MQLIHRYLESAKLLATALVSSRLDYCSWLLYGITDTDLTKLQHIQNRLAHLVTRSPPFTQSNFYSANIPGEARLSGATAESVLDSNIKETVP